MGYNNYLDMVKIIIVKKNGDIKCSNVKNISENNLHKKCLLTTNKNFDKRHTWKHDGCWVTVYSKNRGKAGTENKYELPPPLDNELYFGTLGFLKHKNKEINMDELNDFELDDFNKMIEQLFGGFEDLDEQETTSEEEVIPEEYKTKDGYSKEDGFIVSSDEDIEFADLESDEDEYYDEEQDEEEEDDDYEDDEEEDDWSSQEEPM